MSETGTCNICLKDRLIDDLWLGEAVEGSLYKGEDICFRCQEQLGICHCGSCLGFYKTQAMDMDEYLCEKCHKSRNSRSGISCTCFLCMSEDEIARAVNLPSPGDVARALGIELV